MSRSTWINFNQFKLSLQVIHDNGIWYISIYRECAAMITRKKTPSIVTPIAILPTYRYIEILSYISVFSSNSYTTFYVSVCKIAHIVLL